MQDQKHPWTMCSHQGSLVQKFTDFDYGSTESHRLLLYQTSLTEVKQQSPAARKVVLSVSNPRTQHVERKCRGPHSLNLLFQDTGRCTGPALQASVLIISQDTVTATCPADTFTNHKPADRFHPNNSLLPPQSGPSLGSNTYRLKCCTSAPILCYVKPWTSPSLLHELKTMSLKASLDVHISH